MTAINIAKLFVFCYEHIEELEQQAKLGQVDPSAHSIREIETAFVKVIMEIIRENFYSIAIQFKEDIERLVGKVVDGLKQIISIVKRELRANLKAYTNMVNNTFRKIREACQKFVRHFRINLNVPEIPYIPMELDPVTGVIAFATAGAVAGSVLGPLGITIGCVAGGIVGGIAVGIATRNAK